jgi:glutaredoxin
LLIAPRSKPRIVPAIRADNRNHGGLEDVEKLHSERLVCPFCCSVALP